MRRFISLAHVDSNHENDGVRVRCLTVWLWANISVRHLPDEQILLYLCVRRNASRIFEICKEIFRDVKSPKAAGNAEGIRKIQKAVRNLNDEEPEELRVAVDSKFLLQENQLPVRKGIYYILSLRKARPS